jgi:nitroreductase
MNLAKFFKCLFFSTILILTNSVMNSETKDVHTIIRTRRSIRRYKPLPIPMDILKQIVSDATLAPSAGNKQPWEFIIVTEEKNRKIIFDNIYWLASAGKPLKDKQPQAYIIVLGNPQISKEYIYDCSTAIQNILLSAWGYGIGSCWISSINRKEIYKNFAIPQNLQIVAIISLGYPDEQPETEIIEKNNKNFTPYKKRDKLVVPKRNFSDILHIEKY